MTQQTTWPERLIKLRKLLHFDQEAMGRELGVSREWISRLENERGEFSSGVQRQIERMEKEHTGHTNVKAGVMSAPPLAVEDEPAEYLAMIDRFQRPDRKPSTKEDCQAYVRLVLDLAERADDPDVFPTVMSRLKKALPLDEWRKTE